MKIDEIYIDGFGIFQNYRIGPLNQGVNVLLGPNEAGKSTIHAFIIRTIFGHPTRRGKSNLYLPVHGGKYGGRLKTIDSENERYVIERYPESSREVTLHLPDGQTGGDIELSRLLGSVNGDVYKNIYAFGLKELQDFETLNKEEIRDRIYSAGTGIGARSLSDIQKILETRAQALFKKGGSKPEINSLFKTIKDSNKGLKAIMEEVQNYDYLHENLEKINEEISSLRDENLEYESKLNHVSSLIKVWPDWREIEESSERLREIPKIKSFPENGIELLDRRLERIEELKENLSETQEKLEEVELKKSQIELDGDILRNVDRITALQSGRDKVISASKDLPKEEENLARDKEELENLFKEIGPDWNEEKLSNFDSSIPTKEEVRKKHGAFKESGDKKIQLERDLDVVEKSLEEIGTEIEEIDDGLKELENQQIDKKSLKREKEALRSLRAKYPLLKEKESDMRNLQKNEEIFSFLKPLQETGLTKLPEWPVYLLVTMGIFSALILAAGNSIMAGVVVLVIMTGGGVVYFILSKRAPMDIRSSDAQTLLKRSESTAAQMEKLESELGKVKSDMRAHAKICGFDDIPESELIEKRDSELQAINEKFLNLADLRGQKDKLEKKEQKVRADKESLQNELEALLNEREQHKREWEQWLLDKGLDSALTPESVIEIFSSIRACREKKKAIDSTHARIERMWNYLEDIKSKVSSILEDCNRDGNVEDVNLLVEIEKLASDLKREQENSNSLKQLANQEESLNLTKKNLDSKLEEQLKEFSTLLSKGYAKNEEEFRKNGANWEDRKELERAIKQAEQNIKRFSGEGKSYDNYLNELKESTLESLKERENIFKENCEDLREKLSNLREEKGRIGEKISSIEREDESSLLRIEKSANMEKSRKKSEEWSTLILAKTMLRKAIEKYERERQPDVMKESQSFFSKMTLGRYSTVYAPLDDPSTLYIEDLDGSRKDILKLSKATAEQLYLSLRFGFVREFGKRSESLPIIFDDILVNFDPKRAHAACEAINELKENNQVLFFTCHPSTVDLLTKEIPDANVIELSVE